MDRRLDGLQSGSERIAEQKNLEPVTASQLRRVQPVA
jgi:hypothetical protein